MPTFAGAPGMLRGCAAQASAAVGPGSREVPLRPRFPSLTQRSKLGWELGEEDRSEGGGAGAGGAEGGGDRSVSLARSLCAQRMC